jgi:hypothetical protein
MEIVSTLNTGELSLSIARRLGISKFTVDNIRNKYQLECSARSAVDTTKLLSLGGGPVVSASTAQKALREESFRTKIKKKKLRLTARQKRLWFEFARQYINWTEND